MVFYFQFVYIVDYVDGFPYIKPSLHPWDKAYLVVMDDRFDVFLDLVCEDCIDGFSYIKPSLHPWNEAYLVMMDNFLTCSCILLVRILLSIFASIFIKEINLKFSLLDLCVV